MKRRKEAVHFDSGREGSAWGSRSRAVPTSKTRHVAGVQLADLPPQVIEASGRSLCFVSRPSAVAFPARPGRGPRRISYPSTSHIHVVVNLEDRSSVP